MYQQTDPRWAKKLLGNSTKSTIGGFGCVVSSVAPMAEYALRKTVTPLDVNAEFLRLGKFEANGANVTVGKMCEGAFGDNIHHIAQSGWFNGPVPKAELDGLKAWLLAAEENFAILLLDLHWEGKFSTHFVLAVGVNAAGEIICADPAFGIYGPLSKTGGNYYGVTRTADYYGHADADRIYRWDTFRVTRVPVAPPATPPPAPKPTKVTIGVNLLHAGGLMQPAYDSGIRAIQRMDDDMGALQFYLGHKDCYVMKRRYVTSAQPVGWHVFGNGFDPGIIYLTTNNESDVRGNGNRADIKALADYDAGMWKLAKAHGCIYAGGGFSVGNPNFLSPEICTAMQDFYAPLWADGMWMNMHLYSPSPAHIDNEPDLIWYERRWEFLFTKCGFNPTSKARIIADELGIDGGAWGKGSGYPSFGMGPDQIGAHVRKIRAVQGKPFTVGGVSYPSPFLCGCIFQAGDRGTGPGGWGSFNVENAFPQIGAANQD